VSVLVVVSLAAVWAVAAGLAWRHLAWVYPRPCRARLVWSVLWPVPAGLLAIGWLAGFARLAWAMVWRLLDGEGRG